MTTTLTARRIVADRGGAGGRRLHARAAERRAADDRPDRRGVHRQGSPARARSARAEGLGAGADARRSAAASWGCWRRTCRKPTAASISTRSRRWSSARRSAAARRSRRRSARRRGWRSRRSSASARRSRSRSTCRASCRRRSSAPTRSANRDPDRTRSARARRATRQPDGSFVLTGEKMWITNGGFADVFIVFAKVDDAFTAFIVERGFPGVSTGKEEHKLGLLGSSTTPLILQDAKVPAANLLGEIGKGHKIAFNTLNYGRLKLGAMCSGGARLAIEEAARVRGAAQAVRQADRLLRRDQAEARRHDGAAVRRRGDALPDGRTGRRRAPGRPCAGADPGDARRVRRSRRRS